MEEVLIDGIFIEGVFKFYIILIGFIKSINGILIGNVIVYGRVFYFDGNGYVDFSNVIGEILDMKVGVILFVFCYEEID